MRPLPVLGVRGGAAFVLGAAVIRGVATPVLDVSHLLFDVHGAPGRFVLLEVNGRSVALAVDSVLGVFEMKDASVADTPPLLAPALPSVEALRALDAELTAVLEAGRLLPAGVEIEAPGAAS